MARHRDIRGRNYESELNDGYDDDDDYGSYNDHYGVSPSTEAQFLYNRNDHKFEDYLISQDSNRIPEEGPDGGDQLDNSFKYDLPPLTDIQHAQLLSCLDYVRDVVGDSLSDDWIKKAIVDSNFDPENSLNRALSSNTVTDSTPQRTSSAKPKDHADSSATTSFTPNSILSITKPLSQPTYANSSLSLKGSRLDATAATGANPSLSLKSDHVEAENRIGGKTGLSKLSLNPLPSGKLSLNTNAGLGLKSTNKLTLNATSTSKGSLSLSNLDLTSFKSKSSSLSGIAQAQLGTKLAGLKLAPQPATGDFSLGLKMSSGPAKPSIDLSKALNPNRSAPSGSKLDQVEPMDTSEHLQTTVIHIEAFDEPLDISLIAQPTMFAKLFANQYIPQSERRKPPSTSLSYINQSDLANKAQNNHKNKLRVIKAFDFKSPSPDDIILAKQQGAFTRTGQRATNIKPTAQSDKKSLAAAGAGPAKPAAVFRIGGPTPEAGDDTPQLLDTVAGNLGKLNVERETKITPKNTPLKALKDEARNSPSISRSGSKAKFDRLDPSAEFMKRCAVSKDQINLVVVGHVDAGKSTLMGHLLYQLGVVTQRQLHRYEVDSAKQGKGSFMYAWVLDETEEERSRGVTMDVAQSRFETESKLVHLLDAPGHRDFIPNMITGAAQADCALLVVNATSGEFETGFEHGGQTREHTMLIRSLGVTQVVVAINKMDTVDWSQQRYLEIVKRLALFLKQVGFRESDISYFPCSGLAGINLTEKKPASDVPGLAWYKGLPLIQLIDGFRSPERLINKPLRICVQDIFKSLTGGVSVAGRIEAGDVQPGDRVLVMPASETAFIKTMQVDDESQKIGFAGDYIILQLQGIDVQKVHVGSFLCDTITPIKIVQKFRARIVVFNLDRPLTKGSPVIVHYQSSNEPAFITRLISQIHKSTGEIIKSKPRCLTKNTSAMIEITLSRAQCLELYQDFKDLGRFMLRIEGKTIAAGQVTEILQTGMKEAAAEK